MVSMAEKRSSPVGNSGITPQILTREIELRAPESLKPNPRNARRHSKKQIRQIADTINVTGFIGAIVIDETDTVLAGHGKREAAILLRMTQVPTIKVTGLSDAQKRIFLLADNKLTENAGWDRESLVAELGKLEKMLPLLNLDLKLTGFEAAEIDTLFVDLAAPERDPADTLPKLTANAVTRRGDLWTLGPHRLLCADARSANELDRLMGGATAQMAFADPPYNVQIASVQGRGRIKHPEFAWASGEMTDAQYIDFLTKGLENSARVSSDGAIHYVCTDWRHVAELILAGRIVYGDMLNICVWCKTNAGQGSYYRAQHELVVVFRVGGTQHQNNIQLGRFERNRSNVWTYPGVNGFAKGRLGFLAMHPTVKPVALVADAMRDCTSRGDVVLDPFAGSGTTILAAEKVGRRGYAVEYEPRYVDIAVQRWEAYTKADAILESDCRTYTDVKGERLGSQHTLEPEASIIPAAGQNGPSSAESPSDDDWVSLCRQIDVLPIRRGEE